MMKRVGHVATYPGRKDYLPAMLESVVSQLDDICVVLNQYDKKLRRQLPQYPNVRYVIPDEDLKDTGKFLEPRTADEYVFILDDDLEFPPDYASTLVDYYESLPTARVVVGVHGVVYSDLFEGAAGSRFVAKFDKKLARPVVVNQLGTGCSMMRGDLLAPMEYMASSQRFVDVRFARYCHENNIGMVCVARPDQWIRDMQAEESIYESYTRLHHGQQLGEILAFGGWGKLNARLALAVEQS